MTVKIEFEAIKTKARGYVRGSFIDYNGYNRYLNTLIGTKELLVIDTKTGEILNDALTQIPEIRAANAGFFGKIEDIKGKGPDHEKGHHFNVIRETSINTVGHLNLLDREYLLLIAVEQFKEYSEQLFTQNGAWFSTEELMNIWGIKESQCKSIRAKYIKLNLMVKKSFGKHDWRYALSEKYMFSGKDVLGKDFVKMYAEKLNEVIQNVKAIEHETEKKTGVKRVYSAIGTLEGLIPHFHKELYYLSLNPTVSVLEPGETVLEAFSRVSKLPGGKKTIQFMSIRQLALQLAKTYRIKREIISDHLQLLQTIGVLKIDDTHSITRVLIHPDLMYSRNDKGDDAYTIMVRGQFDMHKTNKKR
jgi:hypothetical protein